MSRSLDTNYNQATANEYREQESEDKARKQVKWLAIFIGIIIVCSIIMLLIS